MSASTQVITDCNTVLSTGFSATSQANANAAAGPIQDLTGNVTALLRKFQECKYLIGQVLNAIDSGDGVKTTLQNIQSTLS